MFCNATVGKNAEAWAMQSETSISKMCRQLLMPRNWHNYKPMNEEPNVLPVTSQLNYFILHSTPSSVKGDVLLDLITVIFPSQASSNSPPRRGPCPLLQQAYGSA